MGDKLQENSGPCHFSEISGGFMSWDILSIPFKVKARFLYFAPATIENESLDGPLWSLGRDLTVFGCACPILFFFNQII